MTELCSLAPDTIVAWRLLGAVPDPEAARAGALSSVPRATE